MQFRAASASELEQVMAIIEDGRASLRQLGIDQWQNGSPNVDMVKADLAAGNTMVAFEGDELLGTLAFVIDGEPDYANPIAGSWLSDRLAEFQASPSNIMNAGADPDPFDEPSFGFAGGPTGDDAFGGFGTSSYDSLARFGAREQSAPMQGAAARESRGYVTLHRVAVAANAARRGVATFMIQSSIELAATLGFRSVRVDTHEGNIPMQRMLERNGFTHCCDIELSSPSELTKKRLGYELLLP